MTEETTISRKDVDLESIEYGTPSKGGGKMYLNTRTDSLDDINRRIELHSQALERFKNRILYAQEQG